MDNKKARLREQAEQKAAQRPAEAELPPDKLREALHELRVHQIELEMQNEELRRIEAALDASRAAYFELYDLAPVGYCLLNEKGVILEANLAAAALIGEPRVSLIKKVLTRYIFREDSDAWYLHLTKTFRSPAARGVELRLARPGGQTRWVRVETSSSRDSSGNMTCRAVLLDISERKSAYSLLSEKEAVLNAAIEGIGFPAFFLDREYRYTYFNKAHAAVMKALYGAEIKVGKPLSAYQKNPDDWQKARRNIDRALAGESFTEASFSGKEGRERRYFEVSHWPVRAPGGEVIGAALFAQDVSERKLREAQLLQAQKMEAVGLLAGGVAHDFNNILTAITCYADLVKGSLQAGDPRLEDMGGILAAAGRATTLARQLLAFSRKQIMAVETVDLNRTLGDMLRMLQRVIGEEIRLSSSLHPAPCTVRADPGQLEQAVVNLVINARDAIGGKGEITLGTEILQPGAGFFAAHPALPRGRLVCVTVRDTGRGISPEQQERLFEPFFTTKEKYKGTGLGLAMVYGIMKQSGGEIEVESAPGAGSLFRLYLPLTEIPGPAAAEAKAPAHPAGRGETVLLVDDEELLRRVARRILTESGYKVIAASSGGEALRAAVKNGGPVDLLLTDLVMPGMNGRELARELARKGLGARTLYMSGYADDAIVEQGVLETGTAFISKPFPPEAILQKVREVLDGPEENARP